MGKCTCCGNNIEGNFSFCSTRCGMKYVGKSDVRNTNDWRLLTNFLKNWKYIVIVIVVLYVIEFLI